MRWISPAMYCSAIWTISALSLPAQTAPIASAMPPGITRGHLLAIQGSTAGGIAEVQRDDGATYDCNYDSHTLFERNRWPIHAEDLNAGEPVEVLSDRRPGTRACYVRVMSVVYKPPPPLRRPTKIAPPEPDGDDPQSVPAPPKPTRVRFGYLSFSGTVTQYDRSTLTLHTRTGETVLRLRTDTQYSDAGLRIVAPETLVNQHVYIRAGRNTNGMLEAYQVMWGPIVNAP